MIKVNKKVEYVNGFDGNIHLEDLTGAAQLKNDPIDTDAMAMMDDSYLYASGNLRNRFRKRVAMFDKNRQKRVANRQKIGGKLISGITNKMATKAKTKLTAAQAQLAAAKNAGKTDPALVAALSQPIVAPASETATMSKGLKIGLIVGGVAVIGLVAFLIIKKRKG